MLGWFFLALNSEFSPSLLPIPSLHAAKLVQKSWWNHSLGSPLGSQMPNWASWSSSLVVMRFIQNLLFKSKREHISRNIFQFTVSYNISHKIYKNVWNKSGKLVIYPVSVREWYQLSGEDNENQNMCNDASSPAQIYRKQLTEVWDLPEQELVFLYRKVLHKTFFLQQLFGTQGCFHTIFHTVCDKKV